MDYPPIWVLLTTYQKNYPLSTSRLECALKTIRGIKQNFLWPNLGFFVADDGTGGDYIKRITDEIGYSYSIVTYDGGRKGVGHNMNVGLRKIWEMGADLTLMLEDDWYCRQSFNPINAVNLLINNADMGMVKWGYLSPGATADLISRENHLWWKFNRNGFQYIYTGHASLRHKRLHQTVGVFSEGLRPGDNELDFCGKYNAVGEPAIVWDADYGQIGPFAHIGSESLADIPVG